MNKTFIECTDAIMSCLSEHDLAALQAIYAQRWADAEQKLAQQHPQGIGTRDTLTTRQRLYRDICETLVVEQAKR